MVKQKQRGTPPGPSYYRMVTTIKVVNRKWEIYISEKSFPKFINWKIALSPESGEYFKANYWLTYHSEEDRFTHTSDTELFREDFPEEVENWIMSVSRYLVGREEEKQE